MSLPYHHFRLHSPALAGNLLQDNPVREALIYLPPSYHKQSDRCYPVVYLLHGFGGTAKGWFSEQQGEPSLHLTMAQLIATKQVEEMIIVVPENSTRFTCTGYNNNDVQGHWLDFICHDLVNAIEAEYRCLGGAKHRALMGHSSGADAVLKTLFYKPGFFQHAFAMSPANLHNDSITFFKQLFNDNHTTLMQAAQGELAIEQLDVWQHLLICRLQAALPDVNKPPLYCRLPEQESDWLQLANTAFNCVIPTHGQHLKDVNIAIDIGSQEDTHQSCLNLVKQFNQSGVAIELFEFDGGHVDHMGKSLAYVLPWLSRALTSTD
ncbi:alpha/beta hydrolase [Motilimonas cestriensis]|uniref:alpha/beta hydrolase n=1 Tax=Motilimonas cestriensis TaxID=2742685 RepID=UPI003DA4142B